MLTSQHLSVFEHWSFTVLQARVLSDEPQLQGQEQNLRSALN